MKLNAKNERIKHRYFTYLREAKRASEASVDKAAAALHSFERDTGFRDFKGFRHQQAIAFKRRLADSTNPLTGNPLSKSTLNSILTALRNFFLWLADQPGYRSIPYSDADYFNLSGNEARIARAQRERPVPSLEQIKHVLRTMPANSDIERRNRALIAFALLTGARDGALASFKLKHVDFDAKTVFQDAREVRTKNAKTFTTTFFPVGDDVRAIVEEWVEFLKAEKLWGPDDPLFPATRVEAGGGQPFRNGGLSRNHWAGGAPIRKIFRQAFVAAGLPYFNPHSFRNMLVQWGERICPDNEVFKAWSQNLGHEKMATTLSSYGRIEPARQAALIRSLHDIGESPEQDLAALERALQALKRKRLTV